MKSDLERTIELYTSFGMKFEVVRRADKDSDEKFYGHISSYASGTFPDDYNEKIYLDDSPFYTEFRFKDGKFAGFRIEE